MISLYTSDFSQWDGIPCSLSSNSIPAPEAHPKCSLVIFFTSGDDLSSYKNSPQTFYKSLL